MRLPIVRLAELLPGTTVAFELPVDGEREGGILVRLAVAEGAAPGLRAYVNRCRHANLPLDWGDGRFLDAGGRLVCRAHGAVYSPEDGLCVDGPCLGRKLRPIRVEVEAGVVIASAVARPAVEGRPGPPPAARGGAGPPPAAPGGA